MQPQYTEHLKTPVVTAELSFLWKSVAKKKEEHSWQFEECHNVDHGLTTHQTQGVGLILHLCHSRLLSFYCHQDKIIIVCHIPKQAVHSWLRSIRLFRQFEIVVNVKVYITKIWSGFLQHYSGALFTHLRFAQCVISWGTRKLSISSSRLPKRLEGILNLTLYRSSNIQGLPRTL